MYLSFNATKIIKYLNVIIIFFDIFDYIIDINLGLITDLFDNIPFLITGGTILKMEIGGTVLVPLIITGGKK